MSIGDRYLWSNIQQYIITYLANGELRANLKEGNGATILVESDGSTDMECTRTEDAHAELTSTGCKYRVISDAILLARQIE